MPGLSVPGAAPWWHEWLTHDRRDEYWLTMSPARDYTEYEVPMLHIGGWWDLFAAGTVRNYQGLRAAGKAAQHLWMGPWAHTHYDQDIGDLRLGPTAAAANAGVIAAFNRFVDEHLRGAEPHLPPVRYFLLGANEWHNADDWPPSQAHARSLYLHSSGGANSSRGDGMLGNDPPTTEERPDRFLYDPERPVPSVDPAGPWDRREIEARDDVICFTSEPLPEAITIAGPVTLELWAVSDAPDTDWTAMLVDVYPDGRAIGLCDGILRARYRESLAEPRLLQPGGAERYAIAVGNIACRFDIGHRIRLEISSSNFPKYDPNPNGSGPVALACETRVAVQQVLHDVAHPSRLMVTVMPPD
jgi:putative CocE/NonD family hydrolase